MQKHFNEKNINSSNIDENITVIIGSCLINCGKFDCLLASINNIRTFLPNSEIVIGFDKVGPNDLQMKDIDQYKQLSYFTHNKGLGHTFNHGNQTAKKNIILQTEDDWIIKNKYLSSASDFKKMIFNAFQVINKHNNSCVRLDGGMFDEIGGTDGYPLGWNKHILTENCNYYSYVLPSGKQMDDDFWLHYAFCNHPHLKLKKITINNPYPEQVSPAIVENNYAVEWILNKFDIFYVPINEESIKICGCTNPDKNIFIHIGNDYSYRI